MRNRLLFAAAALVAIHCTSSSDETGPAVDAGGDLDASVSAHDASPAIDSTAPEDASDASDASDATSPPDASDAADADDDAADAGGDASDAAGSPYAWVYQRIGDCAGNDRIAYTTSSDVPVAADCDAANVGTAAVCWDQTSFANSIVPGSAPGCTYKSTSAAACTGGTHPGYLWVCVDTADAGVADAGPPPDLGKWAFVRIDDCAGNDIGSIGYTTSSDVPVAADCTASNNGQAAVCWDQSTYTNSLVPGSAPGCTYKTVTPASCTGGGHPGFMYVCNAL